METNTVRDTQGNVWEAFVNQFQQRQLRCVAGARLGEVLHDPRLGSSTAGDGRTVSSRDPVRPARDPWLEGLYSPPFWE